MIARIIAHQQWRWSGGAAGGACPWLARTESAVHVERAAGAINHKGQMMPLVIRNKTTRQAPPPSQT